MRLPTLLLPIAAIALAPITSPAGTAARPNVVVIISDDGGFADWEFMDKEVGNILSKLDDPAGDGSVSLTNNTLIIFINDNGIDNGLAFFLGAANPTDNAAPLLPVAGSNNGDLEFTFHRTDAAAALPYHVEYGNNLTQWDPHDTAGITITTIDKGPTDAITVSLPAALANGESALFVRLVVAP